MEAYILPKEKTTEIRKLYERILALNDFCVMLAERKGQLTDCDELYEKMLADAGESKHKMSLFWEEVEKSGKLPPQPGKKYNLDFATGEITLEDI